MNRPVRRGVAVALLLVLLTAGVASAHPSFNPNELPAGEAVDAVLVVPHGCDPEGGMPESGAASPTIELDLQLTDEVVAFEAHPVDGWEIERVSDGEVVRWTATDGGTTDPIEFPVTLTVDGPADEAVHLAAFQQCTEGSFRWIGTPDQEAEYPAVRLIPTAGEFGTSLPEGGDHAGDDHAGDDHADHDEATEEPATGTPTHDEDATADVAAADESAEATADTGISWVVVAVVLAVLLAGAGAVLWSRR